MHARESFTLRAYNGLRLNRSGHLQLPSITSPLPPSAPGIFAFNPAASTCPLPARRRCAAGRAGALNPHTLAQSRALRP